MQGIVHYAHTCFHILQMHLSLLRVHNYVSLPHVHRAYRSNNPRKFEVMLLFTEKALKIAMHGCKKTGSVPTVFWPSSAGYFIYVYT